MGLVIKLFLACAICSLYALYSFEVKKTLLKKKKKSDHSGCGGFGSADQPEPDTPNRFANPDVRPGLRCLFVVWLCTTLHGGGVCCA
jgi:hypothetical protein